MFTTAIISINENKNFNSHQHWRLLHQSFVAFLKFIFHCAIIMNIVKQHDVMIMLLSFKFPMLQYIL